jgi:O-acetyl-ADP-ribose deacetylase (regulator of RNase III)
MAIHYVAGDLFENAYQAQALAHGCNCQGSMGAGYGGLSWKRVRPIIERVFADLPGALYVYEEYIPAQESDVVPGDEQA